MNGERRKSSQSKLEHIYKLKWTLFYTPQCNNEAILTSFDIK
jgi:hypothetical protein